MKTLYYPKFNSLEISDRPVPSIAPDEVLLEVGACGICGSELESFANQSAKRTPPIIMGHEFGGTIVKIGDKISGFSVGDRVVSNALVSCGDCDACLRGETNLCPSRQVFSIHRNGAFAQMVNVPSSSLFSIPDALDFNRAALAEPLANGVHMVNLVSHIVGNKVLVIGAGPIGLMALQAFNVLRHADCYCSDINDLRLKVAHRLGAVKTLNPKQDNLEDFFSSGAFGQGLDIVIDAVGNEHTTALALRVLRPGGALVLIGLQQNTKVISSYDIISSQKQIIGSYAATAEDMSIALQLIASEKVDVHSWVNVYSLDDGVAAFMDMLAAKDGHIKSIIIPGK